MAGEGDEVLVKAPVLGSVPRRPLVPAGQMSCGRNRAKKEGLGDLSGSQSRGSAGVWQSKVLQNCAPRREIGRISRVKPQKNFRNRTSKPEVFPVLPGPCRVVGLGKFRSLRRVSVGGFLPVGVPKYWERRLYAPSIWGRGAVCCGDQAVAACISARISSAALRGSAACQIGRPTTMWSTPFARACAGVVTRF